MLSSSFRRVALSKRFFTNLNKVELQEQMKSGALVIDVRNLDEIEETGKLQFENNQAQTLPLPEVENALKLSNLHFKETYKFEKPSTSDKVIFSCRSGRRSVSAAQIAEKEGFTNVFNYMGGAKEWF